MKPTVLVISCAYAVNHVPDSYKALFANDPAVLQSHQAHDFGAYEIAKYLQDKLNCPLVAGEVTRLLVDCNRSLVHRHCFTDFTDPLSNHEREHLIDDYYHPFRQKIRDLIQAQVNLNHQVLHLSIHTFSQASEGMKRNTGLGVLYDPRRHGEKEVARLLHGLLLHQEPAYRIRKNYPYLGIKDNFASELRHQYTEHDYLGLELECNEALLKTEESSAQLMRILARSLHELIEML